MGNHRKRTGAGGAPGPSGGGPEGTCSYEELFEEMATLFAELVNGGPVTASRFGLKYGMPGLTHEQLMTNIEPYGGQVIPGVRDLLR